MVIKSPPTLPFRIALQTLHPLYKGFNCVNRPESCVEIAVELTYLSRAKIIFPGYLALCFEVLDLATYIYITALDGEDEFRIETDILPMLVGIASLIIGRSFWK